MVSFAALFLPNFFHWNLQIIQQIQTEHLLWASHYGSWRSWHKEWTMVFALENLGMNALAPFPHLETWSSNHLSADVFTSAGLGHCLIRAHRTPVYTSLLHFSCSFMMIYFNISLFHWTVGASKVDSPSGSPSIFISRHRAWHMMDQPLMSYSGYYLLSPIPLVLSLFYPECTLISISANLHSSGSMAYFTFLNPGVTFSVFILTALSATCDTANHPSFLRHFFPWVLVHQALSSPFISLAAPSQPPLMIPPFLLVLWISKYPRCSFLHLHVLRNQRALNITHMMKTSNFPSPG